MSLRKKVLAILLVVVALYAAVDFGIQRFIVYPSFIALEREEAEKNMQRCVDAFKREIHHLGNLLFDWAAWDDTYEFVKDRNKEYIVANMTPSAWAIHSLNVIYFCDLKGEFLEGGGTLDPETEETIKIEEFSHGGLPETHPLLAHKDTESLIAGIFQTDAGPMLIASRPIITSNLEGPIRGTMIMGRLIGDATAELIAEQTNVDLKLWNVTDSAIPTGDKAALKHITPESPLYIQELDDEFLQVYSIFPDILGNTALLFRTNIPRDISAKGIAAMNYTLVSIVAAGTIVLIVLLVMLKGTILDPIAKLTTHAIAIGKSDNMTSRLSLERSDEIGILAREFDNMVEQLSDARKKLVDQSYQSGMAELASGVLHNVRNTLTPVTVEIDSLCRQIKSAPLDKLQQAQDELAADNTPPERKDDLTKFLDMGHDSLRSLVGQMQTKLENVAAPVAQIEQILAEQDQFSRSEQPLETFKLHELLNDTVALLPATLIDSVTVNIDDTLAEIDSIKTNRISLMQVFSNVLTNAAESVNLANTDNPKISVTASAEQNDGKDMIHIKVTDNGQGIDSQDIDRVFERDFSTKQDGKHSGIGLHWCANALAVLNGKIYADSNGQGQGASLHILFPANSNA